MELQLKPKKKLKVAIVHDVLLEYGGSERVVEELIRIFPRADFYTFYFNKSDKAILAAFEKTEPKTSFFQNIPYLYKLGRYFSIMKLFSWLYFYLLDFSSYDLIISSSHSYNSKMVRVPKLSVHICYIHTPPRYLYKEESEIAWVKRFPSSLLFYPLFAFLRFIDRKAGQHPDLIVTNSKEVQRRVRKYYGRASTVIYPPVNIPKELQRRKQDHYLVVSRLVRQKGIGLAISTFSKYSLPLVVVGEGHMRRRLEKNAGPTVSFLGRISDDKLSNLFRGTKALIYTALDEDFGIVPVEAMGYGVPVIAYRSGGVEETAVDGETGVFFDKYTIKNLYSAIKKFEKLKFNPKVCHSQAKKFSKEKFERKMVGLIRQALYEKN